MKTIYIGDIHGRSDWVDILEKETADEVIFVGDYFDSFNISAQDQLQNFKDIIKVKQDNPDIIVLLLGNHDIHYYPGIDRRGQTSGYQPALMPIVHDLFEQHKKLFKIAHISDGVLSSHAGVSVKYLEEVGFHKYNYDISEVDLFLNTLDKNKLTFDFVYEQRNWTGRLDGSGDNMEQTPLWIRPNSLEKANRGSDFRKQFIQVVGHTAVKSQIDIKGKATGGRYYYIDALHVGQYLIKENDAFRLGTI